MSVRAVIIIPAKYQASRFPGKPLALIRGRPMIEHVYRQAQKAKGFERVIVATDDERIQSAVEAFGGTAQMTSSAHPSGTDRVAEVARRIEADIVVNVQVDEPLISPRAIEQAVQPLLVDPGTPMATLMARLNDEEESRDPNVVKVVVDRSGFALFFSRSLIPYPRRTGACPIRRHIGLYVYRRDFLLEFTQLQPSPLERAEALEQLRALENGFSIKCVETEYRSIGVDTPEQLELVNDMLKDDQ